MTPRFVAAFPFLASAGILHATADLFTDVGHAIYGRDFT